MTSETVLIALVATLCVIVGIFIFVVLGRRKQDGSGPIERGLEDVARRMEGLDKSLTGTDQKLETKVEEINRKVAALQTDLTDRESAIKQQVNSLDASVGQIAAAFTNDRARGGWGEMSLMRLFELAGLIKDRDFTSQFNAGDGTPDAVVHLPGARNLVIDSKFPIVRFNEALAESNSAAQIELLKKHAKELEATAKSLNSKGYKEHASGGYIVMYLPSQAVWEAAIAADAEMLSRLLTLRVIVAGPNALFSLLLIAGTLLAEHRFVEEAQGVLNDAKELQKRLGWFVGHFNSTGQYLGQAINAFNEAAGSWTRRLVPQVNKMAERAGLDPVDVPKQLDPNIRELATDQIHEAS